MTMELSERYKTALLKKLNKRIRGHAIWRAISAKKPKRENNMDRLVRWYSERPHLTIKHKNET